MTLKSNIIQFITRARDKSNKRVRATILSIHSTIRPNTTYRSVESNSRSKFNHSAKTLVPLKDCESTDEVRLAVKKTAAGKQSFEVLQNAPIIERAFCRSSNEIFDGLTDFERTLADICIGWIGEEPGCKQYIKDNADLLLKIAIKNLTR